MTTPEVADNGTGRAVAQGQPMAGSVAGVFGQGRSGTTWLGSLLNAHANVAYRFEPFHRFGRDSALGRLRTRIEQHDFCQNDVSQLYRLLVRAHPLTEKPPFFDKRQLPRFGRTWLWRLARVAPPVRPIFAHYQTPRDGRMVVFKEVTCEKMMAGLLKMTSVPVVYLLRSPYATVASLVRGQQQGTMFTGRFSIIPVIIEKYFHELRPIFDRPFEELDPIDCNALLWRHDAELGVNAIRDNGRGLFVTYEQLCDEPMAQLGRVCDEIGLEIDEQMRSFVEMLEQIDDSAEPSAKPKDARSPYFTVFRNPRAQKDRWKTVLSAEQVEQIDRIVRPSPVFADCAEMGGW